MARPQDKTPRRRTDSPVADYRQKRRESEGELELHTPFGFWGKISSGSFITTLTIVGLLTAISIIGYFMWDSQVKGFETLNKTLQVQTGILSQYSADLIAARTQGMREHDTIARAFGDVAYVISLPPDKRDKLGLEEPTGLRKRLRGD